MIIAIIGGIGCYVVINLIKVKLQYNDALDAFGIHGVGSIRRSFKRCVPVS